MNIVSEVNSLKFFGWHCTALAALTVAATIAQLFAHTASKYLKVHQR